MEAFKNKKKSLTFVKLAGEGTEGASSPSKKKIKAFKVQF